MACAQWPVGYRVISRRSYQALSLGRPCESTNPNRNKDIWHIVLIRIVAMRSLNARGNAMTVFRRATHGSPRTKRGETTGAAERLLRRRVRCPQNSAGLGTAASGSANLGRASVAMAHM